MIFNTLILYSQFFMFSRSASLSVDSMELLSNCGGVQCCQFWYCSDTKYIPHTNDDIKTFCL